MQIASSNQTKQFWTGIENGLWFNKPSLQYVSIPSTYRYVFNNTSSFSISSIIYATELPLNYFSIFYNRTASSGFAAQGLQTYVVGTNGSIRVFGGTSGGVISVGILDPSNSSKWLNRILHIITVIDRVNAVFRCYVNGVLIDTTVIPAGWSCNITTGTPKINIGAIDQALSPGTIRDTWKGFIGNVVVFNKALTNSDAWAYRNEIGLVPASLHPYVIGHWSLNHRSGKVAWDSVEQYNYAKPNTTILYGSSYGGNGGWVGINLYTNAIGLFAIGTNTVRTASLNLAARGITYYNLPAKNVGIHKIWYSITDNNGGTILYENLNANGVPIVVNSNDYPGKNISLNIYIQSTQDNFLCQWQSAVEGIQLKANNGELINYSDAEAGISDRSNNTAWIDYYTKAIINRIDANGIEYKTGMPEIVNGLLLNATHTITFPLSGTVTKYLNGYAIHAYRLKSGQTLTKREELELQNNLLFANPSKALQKKFDAYYVFNTIDTTSGNRILDLIGANHATVTSTDASSFTIKSLDNIRLGL